MFIYALTFLVLLFGCFHYEFRKKFFMDRGYYLLVFVLLTCTTGLRYHVGGDALMYESIFPYLPRLTELFNFIDSRNYYNFQFFYVLLCALCKTISDDYYFYQFIHSIVVNSVIFWFIWKNSKYKYTVITLLYITLLYFYLTYEIQREILAVCCFLLGYNAFVKGKWYSYYTFAIVGFLFHISAIILFILPLFKLVNFNYKLIILAVVLSIPLVFFKDNFTNLIGSVMFTESMQAKGEMYSEMGFSITGLLAFYFVRVVLLFPYFLYYSKNKNLFGNFDWLFTAFLVISIFSQIMVGAERFLNYLYIPFIILFVDFVKETDVRNVIKKGFITTTVLLNLFFVLDYKILLDYRYIYVYFPYDSIFEKEGSPERDYYIENVLH